MLVPRTIWRRQTIVDYPIERCALCFEKCHYIAFRSENCTQSLDVEQHEKKIKNLNNL